MSHKRVLQIRNIKNRSEYGGGHCTGRCLPSYIRKREKKYGICCICGRIAFAFYIYDSAGADTDENQEKLFKKYLRENYGKEPPKEYSLERFARLGSYLERHKEEKQLDDITWNDLGMDEVFRRIDRTYSAAGEEYLYYTLRNISCGREALEHLEEVVNWLQEQENIKVRIQLLMKRLGHLGKYSLYDYLDNLDYLGERSNRKIVLGNLLYLPFLLLLFVQPAMGTIGIVLCMLWHIMTYFREKKVIEPYIISFAYVLRLIDVCEELEKQKIPAYRRELDELREALKSLRELRRGAYWVMAGNQGKIGGNPLDILADYLRMILHLDIFQFNRMLEKLRKKTGQVENMLAITGYLDMAISRRRISEISGRVLYSETGRRYGESFSAYEEGLASAVVTAGEKQYPGGQRNSAYGVQCFR